MRRRVGVVDVPGLTPIEVTLSIGGAAALRPDVDLEGLIRCSDSALYSAKRERRNRVSIVRYAPRLSSTLDGETERLPSLMISRFEAAAAA